MAYGGGMGYHLHMPSYFWRTFTEYPYISTVLKEIHQDPLRKRGRDKDEFTLSKDSTGLIEKVIALLQSAINK